MSGRIARLPAGLVAAAALAGCANSYAVRGAKYGYQQRHPVAVDSDERAMLARAEDKADPEGRRVLVQAREMTIRDGLILPGSCWDYINEVYTRAGYPDEKRWTAFKGKKAGPYVKPGLIRPGDWLYFINHSYGDIEHSALFVDWIDGGERKALMLSYGGEQRQQAARYLPYDLTNAYMIIRPGRKP